MKILIFLKKYLKKYTELGIAPTDSDSLRLKKISITIVPLIVGPAGFIWSLIYFNLNHYFSGFIALSYALISLVNLWYFYKTKNLGNIQKTQLILVLILPFLLMWSLGGFAQGSFVMIWAFLAPVAALIYEKDKKASGWFIAFVLLVVFSSLIDQWLIEWHITPLSQAVIELFFVLNVVGALSGIYFLIQYFTNAKDKNADEKLQMKNKALINNTKELFDNLSYLQSYKDNIDENLIVTKTDLSGKITFANENFYTISGYTQEEVLGKTHNIVRHPDNKPSVYKKLWETILSKKTWHGRLQNRSKDGSSYWIDSTISPILNKDEEIVEFIAIRHDITKLIEQQAELTKMLYEDKLTGLQNRNALLNVLQRESGFSLLLINIDNFSQINTLYGDKFGDKVLLQFSQILQNHFSVVKECQVFRLNGDEFVLLCTATDAQNAIKKAEAFTKYLDSTPVMIDDEGVSLSVTVGISFEKNNLLLPSAHMAIKNAKKASKNIIVYDESQSLNSEYENNIKWIKKIKDAMRDDRIVMYFQPIMNNSDGSINKYETLIRLIDTNGDVISPYFFLEIAKKAKLYKELTKIVLRKSCEAFKDNDSKFTVNITIDDILDKDINAYIYEVLETFKIAERLTFEIVESEIIKDFDRVEQFITKLKSLGCKIAIDDFGTGYSNFEYLMKLQADYIKIDGSIIKEVVNDKKSALITSSIVAFAREMNIETIGEFVENKEIYEKIKELGVNKSQGFYVDKPLASLR